MFLSRTSNNRLFKTIGVVFLSLIIVAYAVSRSLDYAKGPSIEISNPQNGITATSTTIEITGRALRVNEIFLNGNPILIDENGNWNETIILFPGLNKLTILGKDQFNRQTIKELDIIKPE